jgi:hypothetical protein
MRWRFIDKIVRFEAWTAIDGRKTVSLEEYSLLEPLGRKGIFPESLIVESGAQLARWLVTVSSAFEQTCILSEIKQFDFSQGTSAGSVLTLSLRVTDRPNNDLHFACHVAMGGQLIGRGSLVASLLPLSQTVVVGDMQAMWQELYGKTPRA